MPILAFTGLALRAAEPVSSTPSAADAAIVAAVRAADDARIVAALAADRARLEATLSDGMRYAHSSGAVDTKSSYVEGIMSGRSGFESLEYQERTVVPVAPGVAVTTGRMLVRTRHGNPRDLDLAFLSVWREEDGRWRLFSWQSSRNPAAAPAPAAK